MPVLMLARFKPWQPASALWSPPSWQPRGRPRRAGPAAGPPQPTRNCGPSTGNRGWSHPPHGHFPRTGLRPGRRWRRCHSHGRGLGTTASTPRLRDPTIGGSGGRLGAWFMTGAVAGGSAPSTGSSCMQVCRARRHERLRGALGAGSWPRPCVVRMPIAGRPSPRPLRLLWVAPPRPSCTRYWSALPCDPLRSGPARCGAGWRRAMALLLRPLCGCKGTWGRGSRGRQLWVLCGQRGGSPSCRRCGGCGAGARRVGWPSLRLSWLLLPWRRCALSCL